MRYFPTAMQLDDSTLLQYESLRSQALNEQEISAERSLGLALFIRRGMLAWIEIRHRCIPATSTSDKQPEPPALAYKAKSEMIKVLANITLFNLKEALS